MGRPDDLKTQLRKIECEEGSWLVNTDSGKAFVSAMPQCMLESVQNLPGEIMEMEEEELRENGKCGINEYALRVAFWQEYERALNDKGSQRMSAARMLKGLITPAVFKRIIENPFKLAWILQPVREYMADLGFMLVRGRERLWDVINMPIYDNKGNVNARAASVVLQAHKQIEDRVLGQTIQKQQQMRVTVTDVNQLPMAKEIGDVNGIDDRIRMLEAEIRGGSSPTGDNHALPSREAEIDGLEVLHDDGEPAKKE